MVPPSRPSPIPASLAQPISIPTPSRAASRGPIGTAPVIDFLAIIFWPPFVVYPLLLQTTLEAKCRRIMSPGAARADRSGTR